MQSQFKLTAGRLLKFAPDWPCSDARVVFDCISGDYWIVSDLAARVLEHFQKDNEATFEQLAAQSAESLLPDKWQETLELTLLSLVEAGLMVDTCGPTAKAVLDDCATS